MGSVSERGHEQLGTCAPNPYTAGYVAPKHISPWLPASDTPVKKCGSIKAPDEISGFDTGAVRSSGDGKGQPSLMPFDALIELSKHFEEGAKHYDPRNWEKGIPLSRYVDSLFRHLSAIMDGDESEPHHRAMAWNALCFLATWIRIEQNKLPPDLCDLPNTHLGLFPELKEVDANEKP